MSVGYVQHVEPAPQPPHGHELHPGVVKNGWQTPWMHSSLVKQVLPHPPQLFGSLASSAGVKHTPKQLRRLSAVQVVSTQVPSTHRGRRKPSVEQSLPQPPQSVKLLVISVHRPLQTMNPGLQMQVLPLQY
jgi:hypothetical protein